jgi:5-formyltetrahydrofolate cyclo-ligase
MIEQTKKEIRAAMLAWRKTLDDAWLAAASAALAQRLLALDAYRSATTVCLFASLAQEVRLEALLAECRQQGQRVLLPAFRAAERVYGFKEWLAGQPLQPGHWGVPEPDTDRFATLEGAVLMVVPGLAFDAAGGRIGYGAGYYDRLLKLACDGGTMTAAGVCFDEQVHASLPQEAWDRRMDFVVTERRTLDCRPMA